MEKTVEEIEKEIKKKTLESSKEKYYLRKEPLSKAKKHKHKIKQLRREVLALKKKQREAIMKNIERMSKEDTEKQKTEKTEKSPSLYDERVIKV
jgi:peptide methionine sulfoxide reductase MsrA